MSDLSQLFDPKIVKLLTVLYNNKSQLFHVTHLANQAKVPSATALRLITLLVKSNIITVSSVGKLKIYQFNDNEKNNSFMRLIKQ